MKNIFPCMILTKKKITEKHFVQKQKSGKKKMLENLHTAKLSGMKKKNSHSESSILSKTAEKLSFATKGKHKPFVKNNFFQCCFFVLNCKYGKLLKESMTTA